MSDGKIIYDVDVNDEGVESKVKKTNDKIDSAAQTGSSAFSEVWTGALRTIGGKLVELGQQAVSAAVDVGKEALAQVASFEQLEGGVDKLFASSADIVKKNANDAFKTAGLSANQYMETVTSFSAALITSLGGDTEQAASLADVAIRSMSDNANTFGTDMESVMNAYMGFSKENYTMLDNLKLGYAGTKEGIKKLISDASKMTDIQKELGFTVDGTSTDFANCVKAIEVMQHSMKIAGTTSKEAAGTIEGSVNSMKAAWDNFLTGTMSGSEFAEVALVAAENVITAMSGIVPKLAEGFGEMAPVLLDKGVEIIVSLGQKIMEKYPDFMQKGIELVQHLGEGLVQEIPQFISKALPMVLEFSGKIRENAGKLVDAGIEFVTNLATGLANSLPDFIKYVPTIISNFCGVINDNMPKILKAGWNIIVILLKGIVEAVPTLIAEFPKIIQMIFDIIQAVDWLNLGRFVIDAIGKGITALATSIPNLVKSIGEKAFNFFKSINWAQLGSNLINGILSLITGNFSVIPNALRNVGSSAFNAFKSINWFNLGASVIQGAINGITSNLGAIASAARNAAYQALQAAKDFLGISSPSKVFKAEVGYQSDAGWAEGITDNADLVGNAAQEVANKTLDASMSVDYKLPDIDSASRDMSASLASSFSSTVSRIIEVPLSIDAREIARATAWDMGEQLAWEQR